MGCEREGQHSVIEHRVGNYWPDGVLAGDCVVEQVGAVWVDVREGNSQVLMGVDSPRTPFCLHTLPVFAVQHLLRRWVLVQSDVHVGFLLVIHDLFEQQQQEVNGALSLLQLHVLDPDFIVFVLGLIKLHLQHVSFSSVDQVDGLPGGDISAFHVVDGKPVNGRSPGNAGESAVIIFKGSHESIGRGVADFIGVGEEVNVGALIFLGEGLAGVVEVDIADSPVMARVAFQV